MLHSAASKSAAAFHRDHRPFPAPERTTIVNLLCRFVEPDEDAFSSMACARRARSGSVAPPGSRSPARTSNWWTARPGKHHLRSKRHTCRSGNGREACRSARLHRSSCRRAMRRSSATEVQASRQPTPAIALARALCAHPAILILDEATNAVDGLSEAAIVETLRSRAGRRTTIVISHHRSTISFCDDVVVLGSGRVKGQAALADVASLSMDQLYEHETGTGAEGRGLRHGRRLPDAGRARTPAACPSTLVAGAEARPLPAAATSRLDGEKGPAGGGGSDLKIMRRRSAWPSPATAAPGSSMPGRRRGRPRSAPCRPRSCGQLPASDSCADRNYPDVRYGACGSRR